VGRGGSCEMGLGVCRMPSRIGGGVCSVGTPFKCQAWCILHVERPNALGLPPPRGTAAVLVLDGKHGVQILATCGFDANG
jgi:hypothetical protein